MAPVEKDKTLEIQDLLLGACEHQAPVEREGRPRSKQKQKIAIPQPEIVASVGILVVLAYTATILFSVQFYPEVRSHKEVLVTVLFLLFLLVVLVLRLVMRSYREYRRFMFRLHSRLRDTEVMRDRLSTYLRELDRRTSRYFHCVTNSKVVSYYLLMQILELVATRCRKIDSLLAGKSAASLANADEILRSTIDVSDKFGSGRAHNFRVSVDKLEELVDALINRLETGIKELEEEIQVFQRNLSGKF